ncbi:MAG: hypothetical protein AAFQ09_09835 [Pseudomonadota bacterium]
MTDAFQISGRLRATTAPPPDLELPAPVPFSAPVFVSDCVTPLAGETVLGLLLRHMADRIDETG